MNTGEPIGISSSNDPGSVTFEQGETSMPIEEFEQKSRKI